MKSEISTRDSWAAIYENKFYMKTLVDLGTLFIFLMLFHLFLTTDGNSDRYFVSPQAVQTGTWFHSY